MPRVNNVDRIDSILCANYGEVTKVAAFLQGEIDGYSRVSHAKLYRFLRCEYRLKNIEHAETYGWVDLSAITVRRAKKWPVGFYEIFLPKPIFFDLEETHE